MDRKLFEDYFDKGVKLGIRPMQDRDELALVIQQIQETTPPPKTVLELGVAYGGWAYMVCKMCPSIERYIGVEIAPKMPKVWHEELVGIETVIVGDGRSSDVIAEIKRTLGDSPLDVLYIDAEHTYDSAWENFENHKDLVRPGGLIIFHDVRMESRKGCAMLFREIMHNYFNIIAHQRDKGKQGVGILRVLEKVEE